LQAFAPGEVNRLGKLKKAQISSEAERLAAGTGWLPAMFRAPEVTPADVASVEPIGEVEADAENHEDAHATA
jgi:ParB family transcriptional regulator, chromosome partitioning protein